MKGYRVSHSKLSCAAVKLPSISVAFNNSVLFSLTLCVHQGTAIELPHVSIPGPRLMERSLSGHCCSSGRRRRNTPNKLALKTTVRELHTSLLPTFYWPKQVTWFLLTSTKRGWIINPPTGKSMAGKENRKWQTLVQSTTDVNGEFISWIGKWFAPKWKEEEPSLCRGETSRQEYLEPKCTDIRTHLGNH